MLSRFSRYIFLLLIMFLASCSVVDNKPLDPQSILETNVYSAWNLSGRDKQIAESNRAVKSLLKQADDLILEDNLDQASDKLERLVRIEPKFAQAWSRFSWIALKNGDAQRSRQLAQRSNSYSRGNDRLKILNWNLIQKAGEQLQSTEIIQQAKKMIKMLGEK